MRVLNPISVGHPVGLRRGREGSWPGRHAARPPGPHDNDLRRTFGSLARAAGADLRWAQKAMGHESITTTARIYAHLYDDELDSVTAALDRIGRGR